MPEERQGSQCSGPGFQPELGLPTCNSCPENITARGPVTLNSECEFKSMFDELVSHPDGIAFTPRTWCSWDRSAFTHDQDKELLNK